MWLSLPRQDAPPGNGLNLSDGRSPGFAGLCLSTHAFPVSQWHLTDGSLAAHSCGGSLSFH